MVEKTAAIVAEARRAAVVIVITAALAACSTYSDIDETQPEKTIEIDKPVHNAAECIYSAVVHRETGDWKFTRTNDNGIEHIYADIGDASQGTAGKFVMWDIAIVPLSGGSGSSVSLRSHKTVWGTPNAPSDIWDVINSCR